MMPLDHGRASGPHVNWRKDKERRGNDGVRRQATLARQAELTKLRPWDRNKHPRGCGMKWTEKHRTFVWQPFGRHCVGSTKAVLLVQGNSHQVHLSNYNCAGRSNSAARENFPTLDNRMVYARKFECGRRSYSGTLDMFRTKYSVYVMRLLFLSKSVRWEKEKQQKNLWRASFSNLLPTPKRSSRSIW